jgi:hypothetical protein
MRRGARKRTVLLVAMPIAKGAVLIAPVFLVEITIATGAVLGIIVNISVVCIKYSRPLEHFPYIPVVLYLGDGAVIIVFVLASIAIAMGAVLWTDHL